MNLRHRLCLKCPQVELDCLVIFFLGKILLGQIVPQKMAHALFCMFLFVLWNANISHEFGIFSLIKMEGCINGRTNNWNNTYIRLCATADEQEKGARRVVVHATASFQLSKRDLGWKFCRDFGQDFASGCTFLATFVCQLTQIQIEFSLKDEILHW